MTFYGSSDCNDIPLDQKLNEIFNNKENGFFIELGANDGVTQSNTAFFEKFKKWRGILIEPSLKEYELCLKNRPNSICCNYACVSYDYIDDIVYGDFKQNSCSLMASINSERLGLNTLTPVKAITLEKILDFHNITNNIDFLSLDTEGYELNILKGLNLDKYRPNYMLIEVYNKDYNQIILFLKEKQYDLICNFSNYCLKTNPNWDGTHNDYLFVDTLKKCHSVL
jgi:FkbM family methyltransferase